MAATGGKFTFSVDDAFELKDIKDFGRGNALQALNYVIEKYQCEIEPDNRYSHQEAGWNGSWPSLPVEEEYHKHQFQRQFPSACNTLV
ncbi:hypothetical protein ACFOQM_03810 [Paenibacillus sp. GCM10012307]